MRQEKSFKAITTKAGYYYNQYLQFNWGEAGH
jgi:hypothetical protein